MPKETEIQETLIELGVASVETKGGTQTPPIDNFVAGLRDTGSGLSND